jgi:integrase
MSDTLYFQSNQDTRNKAKSTGHKPPLKRKEVWAIRVRLQLAKQPRDLALFNLAIDSKLRGCDLVRLRVCDVANGNRVGSRATIVQKKTGRPVQFEITGPTRDAIASWIESAGLRDDQFLFPSRMRWSPAGPVGRRIWKTLSARARSASVASCQAAAGARASF